MSAGYCALKNALVFIRWFSSAGFRCRPLVFVFVFVHCFSFSSVGFRFRPLVFVFVRWPSCSSAGLRSCPLAFVFVRWPSLSSTGLRCHPLIFVFVRRSSFSSAGLRFHPLVFVFIRVTMLADDLQTFPLEHKAREPSSPNMTVWPSGLRRWLKAPFRKGVGSNPTAVMFCTRCGRNARIF